MKKKENLLLAFCSFIPLKLLPRRWQRYQLLLLVRDIKFSGYGY